MLIFLTNNRRNVLGISSGIDEIGGIKWDLFLALLIAWVIVYFSIFRGMKNSPIVNFILLCREQCTKNFKLNLG